MYLPGPLFAADEAIFLLGSEHQPDPLKYQPQEPLIVLVQGPLHCVCNAISPLVSSSVAWQRMLNTFRLISSLPYSTNPGAVGRPSPQSLHRLVRIE